MSDRARAIERILESHPLAFVLLSNGLTSREASHFHPSPRCFYMLHGMGETLSVGVGLARARPELEVVVIEGDYNAIMGLSSWSLMPVPNLRYYVLVNGTAETTGGQPVPSLPAVPSWCSLAPINPGKAETPNPPPPEAIWRDCQNWLKKTIKQ
jgi:thiamine pyrophosphate-dependent acetolactate synthase large subunit-like protein